MYEKLRAKVYSIIFPDGIPLEKDVEVKHKTGTYTFLEEYKRKIKKV